MFIRTKFRHNGIAHATLPQEFSTTRDDVMRDWTNGPDPDEPRELPMRNERGFRQRKIRGIMDRNWY
jgi:hypothetical protein